MLIRKMLRELLENKTAYFASLVIIIIGLLIYTSISIVMDNLYAAKYSFMKKLALRTASLFCPVCQRRMLTGFPALRGFWKLRAGL